MPTALETNLEDFALELATEFNVLGNLLDGNGAATLSTAAKANLVVAVNEVFAGLGLANESISDLDAQFQAALGSSTGDLQSQINGKQDASAQLSAIAALTTTPFGRDLLTQATREGLTALLATANTTTAGIVELSTIQEAIDGQSTLLAVSPAGVKAIFDALVAGAPGLLNTLDEIAAALGDDPNFAATIMNSLAGKQAKSDSLGALAGLSLAANKIAYATGPNAWALADFTAFGRSVIACTDAPALRSLLEVFSKDEIGPNLGANLVSVFRGGLV